MLSVHDPARSGKFVSVITTSNTLMTSIPHLYRLVNVPVVLHVSMQPDDFPDYADITSIRQSGLIMLQSESITDAQDVAAVAHALAIRSGKGVLHFFARSGTTESPVQAIGGDKLNAVLDNSKVRLHKVKGGRPTALYVDDGVKAETADFAPSVSSTPSSAPETPPGTL